MNKKSLFSLLVLFQLISDVRGEMLLPEDSAIANQDEEIAFSKLRKVAEKPEEELPLPEAEEPSCNPIFRPMQIGVRHSQGAGVGYNHGYTTLQGFFSYRDCHHPWIPFVDLRGHMFNNAKYAANTGLGLRYAGSSVAWGINGYYDYRNTSQYHYNQISAGLEAIGSFWSVHLNGYLPVGKKRSDFFDPSLVGTASGVPSFGFFQGNQFFITLSGSQALTAK